MIRILHNGAASLQEPAGHTSVGEAVEAVTSDVVVALRVNGREVPRETWENVWSFSLEGVSELEIESEPLAVVAQRSLEQAERYAVAVSRAARRTAELLRAGRVEDASRLYADVLDALSVLVLTLGAALPALGAQGGEASGFEAALAPWLGALEQAHERADWMGVADLLEYEIAPLVDEWRGRIERAAGAPGRETAADAREESA